MYLRRTFTIQIYVVYVRRRHVDVKRYVRLKSIFSSMEGAQRKKIHLSQRRSGADGNTRKEAYE